ncbi:AAA domain-containing protein [Deinococcus caeni]|uniref:AAA domain-containing protein n=1 Tax=Deinococcus caeni TaxID=569127 RepID=UPI00360E15D8
MLVQGPPGTGKSHTIVNLVSHLLATNQRVLVTSHTERALKVLRDKFPPELAALCVTHLRGDSDARTMLERSVGEMIRRKEHRDAAAEARQEQELGKRLERLRQQESDLLDQLEALRLSETSSLDLHGYAGTPQQIGEQLRAHEPRFEWVLEFNPTGAAAPCRTGTRAACSSGCGTCVKRRRGVCVCGARNPAACRARRTSCSSRGLSSRRRRRPQRAARAATRPRSRR